jgi:5-methylcytosine-specific restriction endonuclease McrA
MIANSRLERYTPLPRTAWVRTPGNGLTRHGRINPVSDRRRAENRDRRKMADTEFGDQPLCAIRWDENCRGLADDLDEILSRGRSGSITDPENCTPACRPCHTAKTEHPAEAEARGLLLPSGRPRKAVPR